MTKPKAKVRKVDSDKDAAALANTPADIKTSDNTGSSNCFGAASSKNSPSAWFTTEIQAMMHGFGDCSKPLFQSAKLIEEIVHQQMNSLLIQLAEIASNRGVRFIGIEDIVFLLRKDKVKLSRLLRYLSVKDLRMSSSVKSTDEVVDDGATAVDVIGNAGGISDSKSVAAPLKKRLKMCQDFINTIDQTGELLALFEEDVFDEVKHERDMRADIQSQNMDLAQYIEFAEARRASFARKYRSTKFRDWILKDNLVDIKPNTVALEILNYLAYETVAQIVDLALLVKQDANASVCDPVSKKIVAQCFNHDFPSVRLHQLIKSGVSMANTPPQSPRFTSPPVSPVSLASASHASTSSALGSHQTGAAPTKAKAKKRKKSGPHSTLEIPFSQIIQPADIREAIRRYWYPKGPMVPFNKIGPHYVGKRLFCC